MDPPSTSQTSQNSHLFAYQQKESGIELEFPENIRQQIRDFESVVPEDSRYSKTLLKWGSVLVNFVKRELKKVKPTGGKDRNPQKGNFLRNVLMMAINKFETLAKINKDNAKLLEKWGDALLILSQHYDQSFCDSACEKYFSALLLKTDSSKLHRKYAVALSKKADLMYRTEHKMEQSSTSNRNEKLTPSKVIQNISTIQSLTISDLCNLADVHFGKAVALRPKSAKTYVLWAKSLQTRMERTRDEATAISLLTAISSKWHQALALKPKNAHYLSRWAQSIDFLIDLHATNSRFEKKKQHEVDISNLIEIYLQAYRHLANITKWKLPLPIKPLIAFALLENEKVSPLALQVLKDITENSLVKETKQEAERNMKMLEEILKNRQEMNSRNKQRVFETFKELPKKLQLEITKGRGHLTDEEAVEIGQYFEIFLNCIHFVLRRYLDDDNDGRARKLYNFLHKRSQSIRNVGIYVANEYYKQMMKEARNKEQEYKLIKIKSKIEQFEENPEKVEEPQSENKNSLEFRTVNEPKTSQQSEKSTSPTIVSSLQQTSEHLEQNLTQSPLPPAPSMELPSSTPTSSTSHIEVIGPSTTFVPSLPPIHEHQSTTEEIPKNEPEPQKTQSTDKEVNKMNIQQNLEQSKSSHHSHSQCPHNRHLHRRSSYHSTEIPQKSKKRSSSKRSRSRDGTRQNKSSNDSFDTDRQLKEHSSSQEKKSSSSTKDQTPLVINVNVNVNVKDKTLVSGRRPRIKSTPPISRNQNEKLSPISEKTEPQKQKKQVSKYKDITTSQTKVQPLKLTSNEIRTISTQQELKKPISEMTMEELETFFKRENPKSYYKNRREIGTGGFGYVYIATPRSKGEHKQVAIKVSRKEITTLSQMQNIVREICVMKECKHKNIVSFLDAYLWEQRAWIVMEYCDGGSLATLAKGSVLTEPEIAFIIRQIVEGLAFLHSHKRVHRDIKADNILLNFNGEVKIADLGLVEDLESQLESSSEDIDNRNDKTKRGGMAGSCYWMAPEIIKKYHYGSKVDIWALGCLLYELIEHEPPYYNEGALMAMFFTATRGAPPLKNYGSWSEHLIDFISLCLQVNPKNRPSARMLLQHPFLQQQQKFQFNTLKNKMEAVFINQILRDGGLL